MSGPQLVSYSLSELTIPCVESGNNSYLEYKEM